MGVLLIALEDGRTSCAHEVSGVSRGSGCATGHPSPARAFARRDNLLCRRCPVSAPARHGLHNGLTPRLRSRFLRYTEDLARAATGAPRLGHRPSVARRRCMFGVE